MYTFELEFLDDSGERLSGMPIARVRVALMSGSDPDPRDVTADCASRIELDEQIDRLISELGEIRKQAHRKFAAYDKRWSAATRPQSD